MDPDRTRRAEIERVMDRVRDKLGDDAIMKGRALGARGGAERKKE